MNDRLYRTVDDRVIAGVCGGLAARLEIDPSLVRIAFAVAALLTGIVPFVVIYVVMAAVVPEEPAGFAGRAPGGGFPPPGPNAVPGWMPPGATPGWTPPGATRESADAPGNLETPSSSSPPAGDVPPWSSAPAWSPSTRGTRRGASPVPAVIGGIVLVALGIYFLVRDQVTVDWGVVWAAGLVTLGVVVVVAALLPRR